MASTLKGYDPDLGRKFAQESSGFVIGRAKSLPQAFEEEPMPEGLDAQEQHDWLLAQRRKRMQAESKQ